MSPGAGDIQPRRRRPQARRRRPRAGRSRHQVRRPDATADPLRQPRPLSPVAAILPRDGDLAATWRTLTAGATGLPLALLEMGLDAPLLVVRAPDLAELLATLVVRGPAEVLDQIAEAVKRPAIRLAPPPPTPAIVIPPAPGEAPVLH